MRTILVNLPGRMVIDGNAFVMLIKQERFRGFIVGGIGGATAAEVLMSLPAESREGPVYGPACRTLMGASGISPGGNLSGVTRPLDGSVHDFIRLPAVAHGRWRNPERPGGE